MSPILKPPPQLLYYELMLSRCCRNLRIEADIFWTAATGVELFFTAAGFYGAAKAQSSILSAITIAAPSLWMVYESNKMRKIFSFISTTAYRKEHEKQPQIVGDFSHRLQPLIANSFFLSRYFKIDCPKS